MVASLIFSGILYAQQPKGFGKNIERNENDFVPCASAEYLKQRQSLSGNWLAPKVAEARRKRRQKDGNQVVTLPVVVHVIHNGDAIGTDENISDAQILSQIQVLNEDFRRMEGTPGHNPNTPGVDTEIQFCLAQRDPNGNATNGIDRVEIDVPFWGMDAIEFSVKPETIWNPEKYINIWVCKFGGFFRKLEDFRDLRKNNPTH